MKIKYKKINQYIERRYRFDVGYQIIKSCKGFYLAFSQINESHSERMKILRENRKWFKHLYDVRHRINQKERRILRESRKQFIGVIDEIEI